MSYRLNDFQTDLSWSELPEQYAIYVPAILHWWPNVAAWKAVTDKAEQKRGVDIILTLSDGAIVKLQFKARRKCYDDICIEHMHIYDDGKATPGWIETPSDANYLIYCAGNEVIYRIDYPSLHSVWQKNWFDWLTSYLIPPAKNTGGYQMINVAVPVYVLQAAGVEIDQWML